MAEAGRMSLLSRIQGELTLVGTHRLHSGDTEEPQDSVALTTYK